MGVGHDCGSPGRSCLIGTRLRSAQGQSRRIKQVDDTSAKPPIASIRPAGARPTRRASSNIDGIDLGPRGRLMREHGGDITLPNIANGGLRARVELPTT